MSKTTVYVVTDGSYSDYGIKAIFSTKELAEEYQDAGKFDDIEEWELDAEVGKIPRETWNVTIDCTTGELMPVYHNIASNHNMGLPSDRGFARDLQRRNNANSPFETVIAATSYESPEHAQKLAIEARQAWLREQTEHK